MADSTGNGAASQGSTADLKPLCQILTPIGMLGYGFDETIAEYALARIAPNGIPTAIIVDSGSTDAGPENLALGTTAVIRASYVKDISKLLRLAHKFRVKVIVSSAGGDGANEHVDMLLDIIKEVAAEESNKDYYVKAISIYSGIDKSLALKRLQEGRIVGCGPCVGPLTADDIHASSRIVAQMGPEPFIDAMEAHPDFNFIIGGRAYDPAPYAAFATYQLKRQYPEISTAEIHKRYGGFLHFGKIMECGGLCAVPKSPGAVGVIYENGVFDIWPMLPGARCTPYSVAAHALYENTRPDFLRGPGGSLHLENSKYEQLPDGRTARVRGSEYRFSRDQGLPHTFKLEAARVVGYRSMFMGSVKDHTLVTQIDALFPRAKAYVREQFPDAPEGCEIDFHVYGRGQSTPDGPGELFIIAESLAPTQVLATSMAGKARVAMIHGPYPGMKATAGNFAFGLGGKMEVEMGPCCKFSLYHLMELEAGEERLRPEGSESGNQLLSSKVTIIGKGQPVESTEEFRAGLAQIRDSLPVPEAKASTHMDKLKITAPTPENPKTLWDVARVLRSKNAGPYEITLDVIFHTEAAFHAIKNANFLTPESVSKALGITPEDIIWLGFYEPALAFKVTIPRFRNGKRVSAGTFMENDVHGSQKHLGLAKLPLPDTYTHPPN